MWKANSAELWRCPIVYGLHAGSTPVGVSAYRKHAAGNSIERKSLYRGHQSNVSNVSAGKQSSTFTLQLALSLSIYFFLLSCFFSLCASPDCGVPSPVFSREIRLTCRGLKGICSAHQVCIMLPFLWTAPTENVKQTEKHGLIACGHSPCSSKGKSRIAAGMQLSNESVPHIWLLYWAGWAALIMINLLCQWFCWTNKCPMTTVAEQWDMLWHLKYHPHNQSTTNNNLFTYLHYIQISPLWDE